MVTLDKKINSPLLFTHNYKFPRRSLEKFFTSISELLTCIFISKVQITDYFTSDSLMIRHLIEDRNSVTRTSKKNQVEVLFRILVYTFYP